MQSMLVPRARLVPGQVMADNPGSGSVTTIGSRVTLPVFWTVKV